MIDKPLYESWCMTDEQWVNNRSRIQGIGQWEFKLVPCEQRVYLRRHISGPVNTTDWGWAVV